MLKLNLTGQQVAVFGASRGIGAAITEAFLAEGCNVFGFDRTTVAHFQCRNGISICAGDVTCDKDIESFLSQLPPIDHVVYSVGIGSGAFGFPFWKVDTNLWFKVLDVNLLGAVRVAKAFGPLMADRRRGTMLFLSSVAGQIGSQTDPPYSASKAGLNNFVQCLAKDLAPFGVRANTIAPGMVKTDLNHSVWQASQDRTPEPFRTDYLTWADEKIRKVSPLGRWQELHEFAAMSVFLASEYSRNITGQTINIDGGWVMHS